MKKILKINFIFTFFIAPPLLACPLCGTNTGKEVLRTIFTHDFISIFISIFSIFFIYGLIVIIMFYIIKNSQHNILPSSINKELFFSATMLLGAGIAGFLDGIIFHQIFQMHAMISNKIPMNSVVNVESNMFWDGIFHAFTLITFIIGLLLLIKAFNSKNNRPSNIYLLGSAILGAGIFNLIEGLIDHEILGLHHVVQFARLKFQFYSDMIFLFFSILLIVIGASILRKSNQCHPRSHGSSNGPD